MSVAEVVPLYPGAGYKRRPEDILALWNERRLQHGEDVERMRTVAAGYNGEIAVPLPEIDKREGPMIANYLAQGIDGHGMRIASVMPGVFYPPEHFSQATKIRKAHDRRQATYGWWDQNEMNLRMRRRGRWLAAYSSAPVVIRPDVNRLLPVWELRNPLDCYPGEGLVADSMTPPDVIFAYQRSGGWMQRCYPQAWAQINADRQRGDKMRDTSLVNIVEYIDNEQCTVIATGTGVARAYPEAEYGDARIINLGASHGGQAGWIAVCETGDNLAGCCPVVVPGRITLSKPKGQFDDSITVLEYMSKLMALELHAVSNAVFPDTWFIHDQQGSGQIITQADGLKGEIGEAHGGKLLPVQLAPGFQTYPTIDRLERSVRLDSAMPAEMGGECVDEQTEIFTADGWKHYDEVAAGTEVLTLNHETGLSEWQPIQRMNVYPAEQRQMILMEGTRFSALTTPNHRWPVVRRDGQRVWRFSSELDARDSIPLAAVNADIPTEPKWTDALVETVAWFYTEGSSRKSGGQISQSILHPENLDRIRAGLTALFGPATQGWRYLSGCGQGGVGHDGVPRWNETAPNEHGVIKFNLSVHAVSDLLTHCPGKVPTHEFLRSLTRAQLDLFISVSLLADNAGSDRFGQKDPARAEAFGFACILAGHRVSYRVRIKQEHRPGFRPGDYTAHIVRKLRRRYTSPVGNAERASAVFGEVPFEGMVWCPTTPNGSWLARRFGSTYYTGNSGSNIRTDRRGQSVLSAAIDFHIQEHQDILAQSLEHECEIAAKVEKAYWPAVRKSFYVSFPKARGPVDYTAEVLWDGPINPVVEYANAGMDANQLMVLIGQQIGTGTLSKESAMRQMPNVPDPEQERLRIDKESMDAAIMSGFQQQLASGALPMVDAGRVKKLRLQGMELEDAIEQAQKEAQERQASIGPVGAPDGPVEPGAPEAQPGLSQPGMGAEAPEAAAIQPPTASLANLRQTLAGVGQAQRMAGG